ncbi:MAG: hypothetical protein IPM12_10880 [Flavobacteriales bacterium]|nr:hypothetical protein [Flavobacteriales bacterium]
MRNPKFLQLLLAFLLAFSFEQTRAQCNPGPIGWLSKLLRVRHTIEQPTAITYTTKPSLVYEIPFFMVVYCAFVEADGKPYLYLWVQQNRMKEPRDMKTGDALVIHLANGATLGAACLSDFPGLKDQSIAFYPLEAEALATLSTVVVDSIHVSSHPRDPRVQSQFMLRFGDRNKRRIQEWAACLSNQVARSRMAR